MIDCGWKTDNKCVYFFMMSSVVYNILHRDYIGYYTNFIIPNLLLYQGAEILTDFTHILDSFMLKLQLIA